MKTKLLTICLLLSTLLSGCYTAAKMQAIVTDYTYEDVDELVTAVGMPSEERVVLGRRILTWYVSNKGVIPITSPTTSTATVYGYGGVTQVTITSSKTRYVPFDYNCQLDAQVTDKYQVIDINWSGNIGGCRIFYNQLKGWQKTKKRYEKEHLDASYGGSQEKYDIALCKGFTWESSEIDRSTLKIQYDESILGVGISTGIIDKWCENKEKDGVYEIYHSNGQLDQRTTIKNGFSQGKFVRYRENGVIYSETYYKSGKLNGMTKLYFPDGKLMKEVNVVNNKKDGILKSYWESGKLYEKCSYKFDRKNGTCSTYRENGQIIEKENYKNGKLIK